MNKMHGFSINPMTLVQVLNGNLPNTTPLGTARDADGNFHTVFVRTHKVRVIRDGRTFEVREVSKTKDGERVLFNFRKCLPKA
jgi:hypothetical protein